MPVLVMVIFSSAFAFRSRGTYLHAKKIVYAVAYPSLCCMQFTDIHVHEFANVK